jgi:4-hydroxymandelate oxidase
VRQALFVQPPPSVPAPNPGPAPHPGRRSCAELETHARALLPAASFDYLAGGAGQEITLAENARAWAAHRFRPRVLRDVSRVDIGTTVLGTPVAAPILVAPAAAHGLAHPDGELATARGAAAAGSVFTVSSRSSHEFPAVAAVTDGPLWFQVYILRDREQTLRDVRAAREAGARALVLTVDTPYLGVKARPAPGLVLPALTERPPHLEQDPTLTFEAIGWLSRAAGLPVLCKGVLRGDDAAACIDAGAAGVVVSNHGGRQLDQAVPTAQALAEVVRDVAGRGEVYVDGGIRTGLDVLAALALGARAVLVGRPVLWALAAGGAEGVAELLTGLAAELAAGLALLGVPRLADLSPDLVVPPDFAALAALAAHPLRDHAKMAANKGF